MSDTHAAVTTAGTPRPDRSGAVTAAGVLFTIASIGLTGLGLLLLVFAGATESTGGMEDLGIALAAAAAGILLPIGVIGLVIAWRLFRRGHVARVVAIVYSSLAVLAALLIGVADVLGGQPESRALVAWVVVAAWYLVIAVLLLLPTAARDVQAARRARELGGRAV